MAKSIVYDSDAQQKILNGIEKLEKAVAATLGPCGKNVLIEEYGTVHSTRDGVTVAKNISLKDKFEDLGAKAVKEVAEKSADKVGDGTTTSTVLAASIFRNGLKHVSLGANATQIKYGIKKASDKAIEFVKSIALPIEQPDIRKVAIVSANGDEHVGNIISDVMSKIGADGTVKVENGKGLEMSSKIVEGMVLDKSYISSYMATNMETLESELDNPWVLLVDNKISSLQEIIPTLQAVSQTGRPLFIVAESYADEVLASLVMTKLRGGLVSVGIESPSYGENKRQTLEDIAVLTGGRVVSESTGTRLENALPASGILGSAKRIVVTPHNTAIIGGCGNKDKVNERAATIRAQIESAEDYAKEKLQERLAHLTASIGIITVGAPTETECKELRDRVDDAFCAAKAAMRSGIVAGGGTTLLMTKRFIEEWLSNNVLPGDEAVGAKIFADSLEAPIRKILSNAGVDASLIVGQLLQSNTNNSGYNVLTKSIVNMLDDGIIDPAEVVENEIRNATSVSGLLLTTDVLIVNEPEDNKQITPMQPMM